MLKFKIFIEIRLSEFKPKHTLQNKEKFANEREKLGELIVDGMETSGGIDIDWVVERRGDSQSWKTRHFPRTG